jgi:hypothetical protein
MVATGTHLTPWLVATNLANPNLEAVTLWEESFGRWRLPVGAARVAHVEPAPLAPEEALRGALSAAGR